MGIQIITRGLSSNMDFKSERRGVLCSLEGHLSDRCSPRHHPLFYLSLTLLFYFSGSFNHGGRKPADLYFGICPQAVNTAFH